MATRTVGAGKTYSTIAAAYAAADASDTIELYYKDVLGMLDYSETITANKAITIQAIDPIVWNISATITTTANITLDGIMFYAKFNVARYFNITGDINMVVKNCYMQNSGSTYLFAISSAGAVVTMYNNILQSIMGTNWQIFNYTGTLYVYNNVFIYSTVNSNYGIYSDSTTSVYNNIIINAPDEPIRVAGGTLNYDYNLSTTAQTTGTVGANNVVVTHMDDVGFAWTETKSIGEAFNFRVLKASEQAGTATPNGVDLTALFTTDIDGRARTNWSMGCSEGYDLFSNADFSEPENVLTADTTNGVAGTYNATELIPATVKLGTNFDVDSVGTYAENPDYVISSQGGNYVDTNLIPENVKLAITYGIDETGTWETDFPAETDVFLNVVYDNGNKTGSFAPYALTTQTGNLVVPSPVDVAAGVFFDSNSSVEGTYDNSTNPDYVLLSQGGNYNDTNLVPANIKKDIIFGIGYVGILEQSIDINLDYLIKSQGGNYDDTNLIPEFVKLGVNFGIGQYGSYYGGPAGDNGEYDLVYWEYDENGDLMPRENPIEIPLLVELPNPPIVIAKDGKNGTAVITVSGTEDIQQNTLYYLKEEETTEWAVLAEFRGDKSITFTEGVGVYYFFVSTCRGGAANLSNLVKLIITDTVESIVTTTDTGCPALEFNRVWVDNLMVNGAIIFWEMRNTGFSSNQVAFTIEYGRAPTDNFTKITTEKLRNTYFYLDNTQRLFDKNLDLWYRVRAHYKGAELVSEPIRADGGMPRRDWLLAKEIVHREYSNMVKGPSGVCGNLLKRRNWGERCPECTDHDTSLVVNTECKLCYGTGIVGGYYPATDFWILPTKSGRSAKRNESGHHENTDIQARCVAYPMVSPGDVWASNETGQRYIIGEGSKNIMVASAVRNKPLILNINMGLAPAGHIVYDIPLEETYIEGTYSKPEVVIEDVCEKPGKSPPAPFYGFDFKVPD